MIWQNVCAWAHHPSSADGVPIAVEKRLSVPVLLLLLPALPDVWEKSTEVVLKEMFAFTFSSLASFNPHVNPLQQM